MERLAGIALLISIFVFDVGDIDSRRDVDRCARNFRYTFNDTLPKRQQATIDKKPELIFKFKN
jgi:hypothetical protein